MRDSNDASPHHAVLRLLLALIVVFAAVSLLPPIRQHSILGPSFWGWTTLLLLWLALLTVNIVRHRRQLSLEFVPRKQHYIQATVQLAVFVYWGWLWRQVYDEAALILAQIVFAYAFDMLLAWSRRDKYVLGFGPFPIIFSTNLFLWFHDDWFYLQFLMIAVGFLGKEFLRWHRDGKHTHIFNPSAFSLGLFSLVLILTGTTDQTWGPQIATTLNLAPDIYLFVFLLGLVVMVFFATTLVSAVSAATIFGLSALYATVTGVVFFIDSEIPIAVFLGLHLLVTDPSTSPKTPLGKVVFGLLYGLGVFGLYEFLGWAGAPTFYDKLLCVPLLNLSVQVIDRLVQSGGQRRWLERVGLQRASSGANLAHMAVWIAFFSTMATIGSTDGRHTGDRVPFWQQACNDDHRKACDTLRHTDVELIAMIVDDNRQSDIGQLSRITIANLGRVIRIDDVLRLPTLMRSEIESRRPALITGPTQPKVTSPTAWLPDDVAWPAIDAYLLTRPRDEARIHLISERGDVLVASLHAGAGRVVAITSGLSDWTANWLQWKQWSNIAAGLKNFVASQSTGNIDINLQQNTSVKTELNIELADRELPNKNLLATLVSPSGRLSSIDLRPRGPGQLGAELQLDHFGQYSLTIDDGSTTTRHSFLNYPLDLKSSNDKPIANAWLDDGLLQLWRPDSLDNLQNKIDWRSWLVGLALLSFLLLLALERLDPNWKNSHVEFKQYLGRFGRSVARPRELT